MIHLAKASRPNVRVCQTITRNRLPAQVQCTLKPLDVTCERCMSTMAYRDALYAAFPKVAVVFDGVAK